MKIGDPVIVNDKVGVIKWIDKPYNDIDGNPVDISVKITIVNETPEYLEHKKSHIEANKILAKKKSEIEKLEKDIEALSHFKAKFETDEWLKLSQIKERSNVE